MRISRTTTFESDVEDVFAVIATEQHQQAKVTSPIGRASASVVDSPGGGLEVRTERVLPTQGMQATVSSLVGETLTVAERQVWHPRTTDGTRSADLTIDVVGAPVRLRGTVVLSPEGTGSRLGVDADLTCSVPLVGRKIESAAKPTIEESFDSEVRLLRDRLG